MPELPEVETIRRNLHSIILNEVIDECIVYYRPIVSNDLTFEKKLKGQKINDIQRQAKYLKFILDDYVLISHLRMEGKYFMDAFKSKHIHVVFKFKSGHTLSYEDTRKFGRFELIDIKDKDTYLHDVKKLAPDPNKIDLNTFYLSIKTRNKTIKEILLDQTIIGGIGNIYANEILYLSKIHPSKKGFLITYEESKTLLDYSNIVLNKAILMGGSTIDTYESLGHKGMFQQELKVHGKNNETCKVCGDKIKKYQLKGRGTYICPTCQKSHIIAITGGIATGKTTATNYLRKKGFVVIDADLIVHELYKNESFSYIIGKTFNALTGNILDKQKLASVIFSNKKHKKKLEDIIHPLVYNEIEKQKASLNEHILFLDIPLLFESNYSTYDESILIDTSSTLQLTRLMDRNKLNEQEAMKRIKAQMPLSKKRKLATLIIKNTSSKEALYNKLDQILERYK
ncbi:DNA-formamidopyrimidine glycosylase [Acholeplasma granularum]|uniref:DNA-formamidopyrimidine glycosylase n=1 Tax=Acholeplasma granularum TaxID=264635 RepID=UPI000472CA5C|nr:DNA-formamidopyrimidine glycosylase [Acholeplasma granularum]